MPSYYLSTMRRPGSRSPRPRRIKRDKYRKVLEYRITGINIFDAQDARKAGRFPYSESDTYRSQ